MLKVAFIRGKFLNNFEGQNYLFPKREITLTGISSLTPIHDKLAFPVQKYLSLADLAELPFLKNFSLYTRAIKYLANRTLGDSQILFGLEKIQDYDIYHAADPHYFYSYQLARLRARNKIKKLILTSWETIPFNNETVAKKKFIKKFTQKYADHILCYTEKAKKALVKEGVSDKKITVINLGVDLNIFKPKKKKKKEIVILFVGRLVEEKGVLDLYEVFCHCERMRSLQSRKAGNPSKVRPIVTGLPRRDTPRNDVEVRLRIIGQGPLKSKLLQLIHKDGLQNYVTIESREYHDLPEVYQQADIFVLPSKSTNTWEEQLGMVLMEAMACGMPLVAYNSGAIAEIVDECGILVKTNNKKSLSRAIEKLIIDCKVRSAIGQKARKRAEKYFDSKKTGKKIAALYKKVYNNHK